MKRIMSGKCLTAQKFFVSVAICIFTNSNALGQPTVATDSLSVQILCRKQQLLLVEPIVLQVEIKNVAATNQFVLTELRNGVGWAEYRISKDGTNFGPIRPLIYHDPIGRRISLATNETYCHEETIAFDSRQDGLVCPVSGDYYFQVDYRGHRSNILKVHVSDPETDEDRDWVDALKSRDVLMTFQVPAWKTEKVFRTLDACARGSSTYSPYAAFALASTDTSKTNALALYEKADVAGFPLQSRAVLGKAILTQELGDSVRSRQLFERLLSEFPATAAAAEARTRRSLNP